MSGKSLAAPVRDGQTQVDLDGAIEGLRRILGMASVGGIRPVDHRVTITGEGQQRTDMVHAAEDTKRV